MSFRLHRSRAQHSTSVGVSRRAEATLSPLPNEHLAHFYSVAASAFDLHHRELPDGMRRSPGGDQIEENYAAVQQVSVERLRPMSRFGSRARRPSAAAGPSDSIATIITLCGGQPPCLLWDHAVVLHRQSCGRSAACWHLCGSRALVRKAHPSSRFRCANGAPRAVGGAHLSLSGPAQESGVAPKPLFRRNGRGAGRASGRDDGRFCSQPDAIRLRINETQGGLSLQPLLDKLP